MFPKSYQIVIYYCSWNF